MLRIFHVFVGHLCVAGEMPACLALSPPPLFVLSYTSCLCISEINPLSVASFANIFSHSKGCLGFLCCVLRAFSRGVEKLRVQQQRGPLYARKVAEGAAGHRQSSTGGLRCCWLARFAGWSL